MSCDEQRPCKRCVGRGCGDQCRDGKRKRRGRKRKTPLPDGEEIDDEFEDFEPLDKLIKADGVDSDTDDDADEDHDHDHEHEHHEHDNLEHNHHHGHNHVHELAPVAAPAPQHYNIELFEDDEESSLSASSTLKIKSEIESSEEMPSRPTTPALPVPMRNPRLSTVASQTSQVPSSSPISSHFDALYPTLFETTPASVETFPAAGTTPTAIDVDSFFAADCATSPCQRAGSYFESAPFGSEETELLLL